VIKQASSLGVTAILGVMGIVAIMAVVPSAARSVTSAQEQSLESAFSNSIAVSLEQDDWKNGSRQHRWKSPYNSDDSANPGYDPAGPNPNLCISCTWPEGSPTFHGWNG
jgi:hypothetical protein